MPPSAAAKQVLEQALALPEAERVLVVAELVASLPVEERDPEVCAELDRRLERRRRGLSVGRPWAEARAELEASLSRASTSTR